MPEFLGIDTSNYTTSCALYDSDTGEIRQCKKLLPVKEGELGIRQSDAVFHHTKQLPELVEKLMKDIDETGLCAVTASSVPRLREGSYMPCFLVGESSARILSAVNGCELFTTSHQVGHVLAALYSAKRLDLIHNDKPFIAFHVSGGTTDCLICKPDKDKVLEIDEIATSLDLKAGQAIDRVGLMLGLKFPCGKELEKLAMNSDKHYKCKPTIKNGSCCLSGLENKCRDLFKQGEKKENIAMFCLQYVLETISAMTSFALERYKNSEIIYAGGVMSDVILQKELSKRFYAGFASPEFSCDNAAGVALYGAIRKGLI